MSTVVACQWQESRGGRPEALLVVPVSALLTGSAACQLRRLSHAADPGFLLLGYRGVQ